MGAITRAGMIRSLFTGLTFGLLADKSTQAETGKQHRVVIQVDQNDPALMSLALNNARNIIDSYRDKNQDVDIKVVAYGPGLHMLREDTSPVKDRIKELSNVSFPGRIAFSACRNTMEGMEAREGHLISIIPQAGIVESGVVYIMELQEQGYSYIKP